MADFPDITKSIFDPDAMFKALVGSVGGPLGTEGGAWGFLGGPAGEIGAEGDGADGLTQYFDPASFYNPADFYDGDGIIQEFIQSLGF